MKIALCGRFNTEKKHQGGSAEVFLALAKGLAQKGNEITLFGRGKPTKEIEEMCRKNKIKFYYISSDRIINILLGPFRALRLMRNHWRDFDIVHTHVGSFAFASTFFRKKSRIVTHVHEIPQGNPFLPKIYLVFESRLLKYAAKRSDETITVSSYMKDIIDKDWGVKNVKSIPNGVNLETFKFVQDKKVLKLFGKDNFKVLFVGRLTERKGILELVDSFKFLKNEKIRLMIIGDGELSYEVEKRTNPNQFIMIKFLENKKLHRYYSSADLVVVPSHYEPGSLVPRESLACGTPILVANNTGLKEIKPANFISSLTPKGIANSIRKLSKKRLPSRDALRKFSEENYDWEKIFDKYEENYKGIL